MFSTNFFCCFLAVLLSTNTIIITIIKAQATENLRGNRFCEIQVGGPFNPPDEIPSELIVYWNGTNGVCPTDPGFYSITEEDIRTVHGRQADLIRWNGVRQFTASQSIAQEPQEDSDSDAEPQIPQGVAPFVEYGNNIFPDGSGMFFLLIATIPLPNNNNNGAAATPNTTTGEKECPGYVPTGVQRFRTFVWDAGTTVYELIAPGCSAIYTMQSINIGRPGFWGLQGGEDDLKSPTFARDNVCLPDGWTYRSRVLDSDLVITGTNGVTPVLVDSLENSYSQQDLPVNESLCSDDIPADDMEDVDDDKDETGSSTSSSSSAASSLFSSFLLFGTAVILAIPFSSLII